MREMVETLSQRYEELPEDYYKSTYPEAAVLLRRLLSASYLFANNKMK